MDEIAELLKKYDAPYVQEKLHSLDNVNSFALTFYKDVAAIYDAFTRVKNVDRNPTGFSASDAPILGLLVRVWKLLKEILHYYEESNAEVISILERPLIEAAVVATFLMKNDEAVLVDYRKCSYKNRLRMLRQAEEGAPFFSSKPGVRLLASIREKLDFEGFAAGDFETQKKNRWKIQGKSFYEMFGSVMNEDLYASTYGMMSESIHGSWNESMDFCLSRGEDGTFSTLPFSQPADVRYVSPTLRFTNIPYRLWIQRIGADDPFLLEVLNWVERVNTALFVKFDAIYDG